MDDKEREKVLSLWKNRAIKAKEIFKIQEISKPSAYEFVKKYHYLKDAKFFASRCYGLYFLGELAGVATFGLPQGNTTLKGWFGLKNSDHSVLELTRLCLLSELNGTNASSYLLGNSIKRLKTDGIRAVITLADSKRHIGSIYQVCNFKYYGLTSPKYDFYAYPSGKIINHDTTKDKQGVWVPRSQKHRYAYIMDKNLKCLYPEQPHPTKKQAEDLNCCNGTHMVKDFRNGVIYTCPICCGKLVPLAS